MSIVLYHGGAAANSLKCLLPLFEKFRAQTSVRDVLVIKCPDASADSAARAIAAAYGAMDYEEMLAAADPSRYVEPQIDERDAAKPRVPGAACLDDRNRTYSLGAVVPVLNEPGRFVRCVDGRWDQR